MASGRYNNNKSPENIPYLYPTIIGGMGGIFIESYSIIDGSIVEKIGVWAGEYQIKSIKLWWTNGSSHQFGKPWGPYHEHSFQPGELITRMSLSANEAGTRLGAIGFDTSHGKHFLAKQTRGPLMPESPIEIGSGICLGVMGRAADAIDAMGFVFLKQIVSSRMIGVQYPTINSIKLHVPINTLKSMEYINNTCTPQAYTFECSETMTTKEIWSSTLGLDRAVKVIVEAGLPKLNLCAPGVYSLAESVSSNYQMENITEKTEKWNLLVEVPANSNVTATLSMGRADFSLYYTGRFVVMTIDGVEITFHVTGVYRGVEYTKVFFKLDHASIKNN